MCRWVSIIPGMTMPPEASISNVPSGTSRSGPTASMRSPTTSTSPGSWRSCEALSVSTVPRRKTIGRPGSGGEAFTGLLSRDKDHLGATGGPALALPGVGDLVERAAVDVDHDVAVGGVLRELQVGLALEVERRGGDRETAQVDGLRADQRGGQRDLRRGPVSHLDVTREAGGGVQRGDGRRAPQHVDGHVDLALGGLADALCEVVAVVDLDDGVGPELVEALARTVGGDHPVRAAQAGDLHRDAADGAGR